MQTIKIDGGTGHSGMKIKNGHSGMKIEKMVRMDMVRLEIYSIEY